MMKKVIANLKGLMLIVLAVTMLTSCGPSSKDAALAQKAADTVAEDIDYDWLLGIKYTKKSKLDPHANLDNVTIYDKIPNSGYAFLFNTYNGAFKNYVACFMDADGKVAYTFSYADSYASFERYYSKFSIYDTASGEKSVEYLQDCNYMSGILNHACDEVRDKGGENHDNNTWFKFTYKK